MSLLLYVLILNIFKKREKKGQAKVSFKSLSFKDPSTDCTYR